MKRERVENTREDIEKEKEVIEDEREEVEHDRERGVLSPRITYWKIHFVIILVFGKTEDYYHFI